MKEYPMTAFQDNTLNLALSLPLENMELVEDSAQEKPQHHNLKLSTTAAGKRIDGPRCNSRKTDHPVLKACYNHAESFQSKTVAMV